MTDQQIVKAKGLGDILSLIPIRLGFHPQESLVVMILCGPRRRDRLVMRLDIDVALHPDSMMDVALRIGTIDDVTALIVLAYSETDTDLRPLIILLGEDRVVEYAQVKGDRFYCRMPGCTRCAPEGQPFTQDTAVHAQFLAGGALLPAPTRDSFARELEPVAEEDRIPLEGPADLGNAIPMVERCVNAQPMLVGPEVMGLVARTVLASVHNRDRLGAIQGEQAIDFWTLLARHCPHPDLYATVAVHHYLKGNGAAVLMATDKALSLDPEHSWSRLLQVGIDGMMPPHAVKMVLDQILDGATS